MSKSKEEPAPKYAGRRVWAVLFGWAIWGEDLALPRGLWTLKGVVYSGNTPVAVRVKLPDGSLGVRLLPRPDGRDARRHQNQAKLAAELAGLKVEK